MSKEYIHDEMETKRKATKTVIVGTGGRKKKGDSKDKKESKPIVKDVMRLKDEPIVKDKDKDKEVPKDEPIDEPIVKDKDKEVSKDEPIDEPIVRDKDKDVTNDEPIDEPIVKDKDIDKHLMTLKELPIGSHKQHSHFGFLHTSYLSHFKPFIPNHYHTLFDNIPIHMIHDFGYIHFHIFTFWFFSKFNIPIPYHDLPSFYIRHFSSLPFYSSLFHIVSQTNTGDFSHDNSGSFG